MAGDDQRSEKAALKHKGTPMGFPVINKFDHHGLIRVVHGAQPVKIEGG